MRNSSVSRMMSAILLGLETAFRAVYDQCFFLLTVATL
jgi:hypothetical protein